jgi:hypothetical protein
VVISQPDKSGFIEANNFGWVRMPGMPVPDEMPTLFSIGGGSSEIYFQEIQIKSAPGTVVHVHSRSSVIQFQNTTMEGQSTIGYLIEDAQHVYIETGRFQFTDACVKIAHNVINVQVESVTCVGITSEGSTASGMYRAAAFWQRWTELDPQCLVNQFDSIDKLNVVAFTTDRDFSPTQSAPAANVSFEDITLGQSSGREPAVHAVFLDPHHPPLTALDIAFSDR